MFKRCPKKGIRNKARAFFSWEQMHPENKPTGKNASEKTRPRKKGYRKKSHLEKSNLKKKATGEREPVFLFTKEKM